MRPREIVIKELVQSWLAKADEDFRVAEHLAAQEGGYENAIGFHCQQAAEKFLKALLVRHQVEFPRTHDLRQLLGLVGTIDQELAASLNGVAVLNPYGVDARYPTDVPDLTREDIAEAVALSSLVREAIGSSLGDYLE